MPWSRANWVNVWSTGKVQRWALEAEHTVVGGGTELGGFWWAWDGFFFKGLRVGVQHKSCLRCKDKCHRCHFDIKVLSTIWSVD